MSSSKRQGKSRILISEIELARIEMHSYSELFLEVGGFLVGRVEAQETIVTASIPALKANSEQISLTFTHEVWDEALRTVAIEYPGTSIVGWYHTHPSFGLFLSEYDSFIQQNFFSALGQVALVVDPVAGTYAWFTSDKRQKTPKKVFEGTTKSGPRPRLNLARNSSLTTGKAIAAVLVAAFLSASVTWGVTISTLPEKAGSGNWENRARQYEGQLRHVDEVLISDLWIYQLGEGETMLTVLSKFYGETTASEEIITINGWDPKAMPELGEGDVIYLAGIPGLDLAGLTRAELEQLVAPIPEPTPTPGNSMIPSPTPTASQGGADS